MMKTCPVTKRRHAPPIPSFPGLLQAVGEDQVVVQADDGLVEVLRVLILGMPGDQQTAALRCNGSSVVVITRQKEIDINASI